MIIEVNKDKVMLHPSFALFNIGKQKTCTGKLCFVRQSSSSLFDFNSYVTTNFNIRIFDEVFDVSNQEELFDKLAQQYPFVVAFSLDKKYLDVGEKSEFSYSVAWPLDSGDDILDAKWGNDAYDFLFNETQKHNADNTYEVRDCIKIEVELIVEQFVDDGFNGYDVNYSFGMA